MYKLLQGMTVVEGASFIAGPTCGLYLAQMGAHVIRFEQIGGGPDHGRWPLSTTGDSFYREGLNKGKQSIAINLSDKAGRALAQRIATAADGLFVTNFPVNGFLSFDTLAAMRPDIVCLRIMGWADGTPAVDYTINAAVGVPMMTGSADDDLPVNHVLPAWDLIAGAYAAFALLAAERERTRSGTGREVRVALSDLAAATMGNLGAVAETLQGGDRIRSGNDLFGAFGRDFLTRDGARLMIVAITPRQWTGLVDALQIGEAIVAIERELGVGFVSHEGARFVHRGILVPLVAQAINECDATELETRFNANAVCWSRYHTLAESVIAEPKLFGDNPIFSTVAHPGGSYPTPGAPARVVPDERVAAQPAPKIGEHTDEILMSLLDMSSTEVAHLHDTGLVA
jgi:2-methylfumaryl-CoA isomerase